MRKEFIIAIISGIGIGLLVAFGIWRANWAMKVKENDVKVGAENTTQTQINANGNSQLTITQPEEYDVITSSPVKVIGISKPDSFLVISGENEDYIIKTSEDGSFEQDIELTGGLNEIIIANSEDDDRAQTKSLRIVYSTEFEKEISE